MTKNFQNKQYSFIFETTTIVTPSEIELLEEGKTSQGNSKITFMSRLQEANVRNNNKRYYDDNVCESIVESLSPRAKSRSLLMEVDHPLFSSSDKDQLKRRAAVTEIKNCGALIRNISYNGNQIIGEIETLSGFKGPDLANIIIKDKVDIGFSLRALGGIEPLQDGTLKVKTPITPITYDVVSNPSHQNSRIMEFLPESDISMLSGAEALICEGEEIELLQEEQITICEGNYCVRRFIDDVIAERFASVIGSSIGFRIGN
ncbi:MAG: S80 family phage morphogenetic serine protease [bacterium]